MQTDATFWAQQCCVLLAKDVASVCMDLNSNGNKSGLSDTHSINKNLATGSH